MKNTLKLNFTEIGIISVLNENYLKKYLDENSYFDTKKFNEELNKWSKIDINDIRNLFIDYKDFDKLLSFVSYLQKTSEKQERSILKWSLEFRKQVEFDRKKIEENLELNIGGFETDFRKKDSFKYLMLTDCLLQFFQEIKSEISEIQKHFTAKNTKNFELQKNPNINEFDVKSFQYDVTNHDFIFAFLETCKTQNIFMRKNGKAAISDEALLEPFLKYFQFKKPGNKKDYYDPKTLKTYFASKRGNSSENDKYQNYKNAFIKSLESNN